MASAAPLPSLRPVPPAPVVARADRADRAADDGDPAPTLRHFVRSDDWHR